MMPRVALLQLVLAILCSTGYFRAAASAVPPCSSQVLQGNGIIPVDLSCAWPSSPPAPSQSSVQLHGDSPGLFPTISLKPASNAAQATQGAGFSLSMKRLLLLNVTLAPPTQASGPKLLPLGMFSPAPTNLSMMDVRMAVNSTVFQQYLTFFSKHLRDVRTKDDGGIGMHTDGSSFLNVPYWSDNSTELYSVTIVSGPCSPTAAGLADKPVAQLLAGIALVPGCNVRFVNNQTLVPTLLRDATVNTTQPLLVRVVTNVSLGLNMQQPIVMKRPVLILGTSSAPVSVNLGMVVNQLDVTAVTAQLAWQAVVLENLAPGDATSSIMAAPYSTTVSTNVWSVYCNRSREMCVPLTNVTLVIPSQDEISYLTFMATMYNSPSPSLRQLADFYINDLKMTTFEFIPGDTPDSLKVLHLVSKAWHMWYVMLQTQPVFAPKLPAPRQVFNQLQYRTGVLVQAIRDCSGFQATQGFTPNRVHVWQLMEDVTIGGPNCTWSPPINITGPTTLLGEVASQSTNPSMRSYPLAAAVPAARARGPEPAALLPVGPTLPAASGNAVHTLSFQYTPGLIQLPVDAPDRYLQIRNITLRQLPQARAPHGPGEGRSAQNNSRRLMQAAPPPVVGGLAAMPADAHSGLFTILLWAFNRTLSGVPLMITSSQLVIPQPEWELYAQAAMNARHFAIDLDGDPGNLLFTGVHLDGSVLTVQSFSGPGISGSDMRLVVDPEARSAHPDYYWPLAASPAGANAGVSSSSSLPVSAQAAIGATVGAVGVLAVVAATLLLVRRRKRRQRAQRLLLDDKRLLERGALQILPLSGDGAGSSSMRGGSSRPSLQARSMPVDGKDFARQHAGSWDSDPSQLMDQSSFGADQAAAAAGVADSAAALAAAVRRSSRLHTTPRSAHGSNNSSNNRRQAGMQPANSLSEPLCIVGAGGSSERIAGDSTDVLEPVSTLASTPTPAGISPKLSEAQELELSIAQGLQNWNDAVSLQTMKLMQQRLQASSMRSFQQRQGTPSTSTYSSTQAGTTAAAVAAAAAAAAAVGAGTSSKSGSANSSNNSSNNDDLQLYEVIGNGSFGAVHLGSWRGKQVAIKVMHLPAQAFGAEQQQKMLLQLAQQQQQRLGRQQQQQHLEQQREHMKQQNSRPHMAIMEAVLSTNLHHPNVVQVYTYMLSPLMANNNKSAAGSASCSRQASVAGAVGHQQQQEDVPEKQGAISGWTLQLVMEFCDQGTLRDQLDRRMLPHQPHSSQLHPAVAVALSHDIAAAMLHLHREGIVHGDLKAGNVLLQASATVSRAGSMAHKQTLLQVWMAAGCLPLTAKVADFGLALPLGHMDTHATMLARGTPTHMAPELFTSGHISKASDVYAFGVLLYELVTGQRAYAGIAIPMLPHRVAVEGLRPVWPSGVPTDFRRLAELCWGEKPQHRPNFQEILTALDAIEAGEPLPLPAATGAAAPMSAAAAAATAAAADPAVFQNSRREEMGAFAAAGAVVGPVPPRPPRHSKSRQQQQQQQQELLPTAEPYAGAAGLFAGVGNGNSPGSSKDGMEWSEVSYGRAAYGRIARFDIE